MERLRAFFACWTRKEAYAKAKGKGLSLPFEQFEVSISSHEPPMLLDVHADAHEASRWSIQELFLGDDYVAALAVEGHGWDLECWKWQDHSG
jgi:4'-phosphopantetheinyl transferase